ncbi:hypothetical protein O3P69_018150 [Scylla paramamosain]|uniref:Uncharacterized protein n=1 Tax=Scylla paramamosain TaxID=85552 RepID=A0AAW0TL33_SCYPA
MDSPGACRCSPRAPKAKHDTQLLVQDTDQESVRREGRDGKEGEQDKRRCLCNARWTMVKLLNNQVTCLVTEVLSLEAATRRLTSPNDMSVRFLKVTQISDKRQPRSSINDEKQDLSSMSAVSENAGDRSPRWGSAWTRRACGSNSNSSNKSFTPRWPSASRASLTHASLALQCRCQEAGGAALVAGAPARRIIVPLGARQLLHCVGGEGALRGAGRGEERNAAPQVPPPPASPRHFIKEDQAKGSQHSLTCSPSLAQPRRLCTLAGRSAPPRVTTAACSSPQSFSGAARRHHRKLHPSNGYQWSGNHPHQSTAWGQGHLKAALVRTLPGRCEDTRAGQGGSKLESLREKRGEPSRHVSQKTRIILAAETHRHTPPRTALQRGNLQAGHPAAPRMAATQQTGGVQPCVRRAIWPPL